MTAEILCVGTELLLGDVVNTNAPFIARRLADLGIDTYFQGVTGDNSARLQGRLTDALSRSDIVVLTGGLGPTYDDLTKETVAEHFDLPLEKDEAVELKIRRMMADIGAPFTENNAKQALIPKGAVVLENLNGTAPGIMVQEGGKTVILLPGPPQEMELMLDTQVLPLLREMSSRTLVSHTARFFGIGEGALEDVLHDLMIEGQNPTIAPYAKQGEVELRVTASGSTTEECEELIEPVLEMLQRRFPENLYGIDVPNLQTALVEALSARSLQIATAESLTGGMVSECITQVPGASSVFQCGICSYSNSMKEHVLGVSMDTLEKFGAVSQQTAAEMAESVRSLANANIAISTTGLAGPDGGTPEMPVGTVFVGIADCGGTRVVALQLMRKGPDARAWIRRMTTLHALYQALRTVVKNPLWIADAI